MMYLLVWMTSISFLPIEHFEQRSHIPTSKKAAQGDFSIDVQHADVHSVLSMIAAHAGVNSVVAEGVNETLSLQLINVTWRDALAAVLLATNLVAVEQGEIIVVQQRL